MTLHWKAQVALVIVGVGLLAGGYQYWTHVQREYGKRDLLIATAERTNADLRARADSLAKAYHVDTVRLRHWVSITDTMTLTVDRWKHDTLRVVEYVEKADSGLKACTSVLSLCEERIGLAQRGWSGARDEIALLKRQSPSKLAPWRSGATGAVVGALAYALLKK